MNSQWGRGCLSGICRRHWRVVSNSILPLLYLPLLSGACGSIFRDAWSAVCPLHSPFLKCCYYIFLLFYTEIVLPVVSFLLCNNLLFAYKQKIGKRKARVKKVSYAFRSWTLIYLKATQASLLLQSAGPVLLHPKAEMVQHLDAQRFAMVFTFC